MNQLNSRGLFNFVLVLLFVSAQASLLSVDGFFQQKTGQNQTLLLEAEQASHYRTLLEENTDSIIEKTIQWQALQGNTAPGKIKKEIISNLEKFYYETGKKFQQNPKIEFLVAELQAKNYEEFSKIQFQKKGIGEFLKKNSKVNSIKLTKHTSIVEFIFTGGKEKNKSLAARISFGKTIAYFFIPVGFTKKTLVVEI